MTTTDRDRLASEGSMSLTEAAAFLGVSRRLVEELAASGELPSAKIGWRRVVARAAVRAYLAERLNGPGPTHTHGG